MKEYFLLLAPQKLWARSANCPPLYYAARLLAGVKGVTGPVLWVQGSDNSFNCAFPQEVGARKLYNRPDEQPTTDLTKDQRHAELGSSLGDSQSPLCSWRCVCLCLRSLCSPIARALMRLLCLLI